MKILYLFLLCFILLSQVLHAQQATVTEELTDILTYPFSDPNPIPILTEKNKSIYPYHSFDGYTSSGQIQKWKVIRLENDYITVYILPEVGGKIWGAIEKSTGKEFIYRNDVMKFRNISMRGPWTSGGIEYNLGLIGHSPATACPVDYLTRENNDGSVSCILGNMDLPSRTQWRVEVRLPKDKAYFETIPLWNNPTPVSQSYYCFMTGAAVVSDDLEFFYPGNQSLEHEGLAKPYPVDKDGHVISTYANNNFGSHTSIHVVGEYNDFMGGYYHKSQFGFGHWALYDDMPGRKLWLWALSREGEIWKDLLTDTHGQYMEFQAGRTFNQYSQSSFRSPIKELPFNPGVTDQWKEIWFPVKDIGGMLEVSPSGILNVNHENGTLTIGINALSSANAKIIVKTGERVILSEDKALKPMDVFITKIPLKENAPYEVIVEGMDLRRNSENIKLIDRPFTTLIPADKSSAASMYMDGIELKENRKYLPARKCFKECLIKDPLYIEAMSALCELYYRSNQLDSALFYAKQALQIDAYNPVANYYAGVSYNAKGDLINALETFGWAARSLEFRSAAYAQMAGIELQLNDLLLAEHYANQSLIFNTHSFNALRVLAILSRKNGDLKESDRITEIMLSLDPLNHFAGFERFLFHKSEENLTFFKKSIKNEFPYQTYLELAIDYFNLGQKADALTVLENSPAHPLIELWSAYLKDNPSSLENIVKESPAFVFPFRTETVPVLKWAISKNNNWRFKYYLGLNLWSIQRESDALQLFMECKQEPDYSVFYLSRAFMIKTSDNAQELSDLQTAKRLSPNDWRSSSRLIEYYLNSAEFKSALALSTEATGKFKTNFNLALQHARAQLNNNQFNACIKTLEKTTIIPFEGSVQGKYVYEQAYLLLAIDMINNKKYNVAIEKLEKSKEWPENLGVGMPYDPDNRMQDYLESICLEKSGRTNEAAELRNKIIDFTAVHFGDPKPSFNNLLALRILQQKGLQESAEKLVQEIKSLPQFTNPVNQYVVASFKGDCDACKKLESELAKNAYFLILRKVDAAFK